MIKIQEKDFNIEDEINQIKSKHLNVGAVSTFIGYVRNNNNDKPCSRYACIVLCAVCRTGRLCVATQKKTQQKSWLKRAAELLQQKRPFLLLDPASKAKTSELVRDEWELGAYTS